MNIDIKFRVKYKDGEIRAVPARNRTIANAIARLYANGRKYSLKEV